MDREDIPRNARARRWRLARELSLVAAAALLLYVLVLLPFTPSTGALRRAKAEQPSVMLSADGAVLAEFKSANREWRPLSAISPHVVQALIATEDRRFFGHSGIDVRRTLGAAWSSLQGERQGGSTLTQQLARNLFPREIGTAPTVHRKLKEALTALKIEAHYSKHEILESYLNTVPFLFNATGIEMAARTYFGKTAAQLDVLESATLVGMLKGTSYYNPVQNPERARQRRNLVLAEMAEQGTMSPALLRRLQAQPLRVQLHAQGQQLGPAPHLAQQVRSWLAEWAQRKGYSVHADGLVVRTTLLAPLQAAANAAVERQMQALEPLARGVSRKEPLQAGFVAIDPRSGRVLAWVGGADFAVDQYDHVQQARRQPGSTFKPFVYAAALQRGAALHDTVVDQVVTYGHGRNRWSPEDGTPATGLPMTLADGLAYSKNTITAQVMHRVGPARVAELARTMGIRDSKLEAVPSLALGTSPVSLQEMVAAYGTIANGGNYLAPAIIAQVEDRHGKVLQSFKPPRADRALEQEHALLLVDALRGAVDRGTARAVRDRYGITADVAGKTGTTQDNTDGWFILMHPQLVAGAWVGFNDSRLRMGDAWGQGASSALPIVATVFQQALAGGTIDGRVGFGRAAVPQPLPPPQLAQVAPAPMPAPVPAPLPVAPQAAVQPATAVAGAGAAAPEPPPRQVKAASKASKGKHKHRGKKRGHRRVRWYIVVG